MPHAFFQQRKHYIFPRLLSVLFQLVSLMSKRRISWEEIENGSRSLYRKIPNKDYDGIVCIATGGLIFGKLLSDLFSLPLGIVSVSRYGKRGKKIGECQVNTNIHWNKKISRKKPSILLSTRG